MRNKQIVALVQIALVWLVCWLAWRYGTPLGARPEAADTAARLAFAVEWLSVPGLMVLLCTILVMSQRFVSAETFDGTPTPASRFMEINLRVARNTLEQALIAAIAWLGLALALPFEQLGLIPVLALLFATGRVLFWAGYQWQPVARAFGFGITALPNAIAIFWLVGQLFS